MPQKFDETADVLSMRDTSREPWLVISSAKGVRTIPLVPKPRVVIGRLHTCDIVIDDDSVSRQHAVIHNAGSQLFIEDLGSRNKTRIVGRTLSRGESAPLLPGAVVEIGYATMFVQVGRPAAPPPSPTGPVSMGGGEGPVVLDPTMQRLYALLDVIAPSPLNVLVLGETGTGKEVFAESLHETSNRKGAPFLRVNCAALSGSLLESELFGHEKGAFTGALGAKAGLFEAADGGTVFLDEVGELPLDTQAKLLRVIERGEVIRLGSVQTRRVDVRYVAATNRDVQQFIADGRFRSDLFFRLNGFSVTLPPLRKRVKEIVPLARLFLKRAAQGRPFSLSADAQGVLEAYPWPGNVRELKNVVERAIVLSGLGGAIDVDHLQLPDARSSLSPGSGEARGPADTMPPFMASPVGQGWPPGNSPPLGVPAITPGPGVPYGPPGHLPPHAVPPTYPGAPAPGMAGMPNANDLRAQRETWEKQQILAALEKTSGNQKEAAVLLGISRRTLINKIEAYGIARPRKKT